MANYNKGPQKFKTHQEFEDFCFSKHGNKYKYLSPFTGVKDKLKILCLRCDVIFYQKADSHFRGSGHEVCSHEDGYFKHRLTNEQFLEKLKLIHGDKYIPMEKYIKSKTKIKFYCTVCERIFTTTPMDIIRNCGCSYCRESKGEKKISKFLKENNIKFEPQKSFPDLIGKMGHFLTFDFYLTDLKILIEYQGEHHYKPIRFNGISLERAEKIFKRYKKYDRIKKVYCKKNKIIFKTISYKKFKTLEEVLKSIIK